MLAATGSPLVAGVAVTPMANKTIKVLRPFYIGMVVQKIGAVIEVSPQLAAELISAHKAQAHVAEAPKPAPKPAKDDK